MSYEEKTLLLSQAFSRDKGEPSFVRCGDQLDIVIAAHSYSARNSVPVVGRFLSQRSMIWDRDRFDWM